MSVSATKGTASVQVPDDKPPAIINSLMRWMLTTPGIQRLVGQGVALLTFTGRRTGKSYTVPVSYDRDGDTVTVVSKRIRTWWRNFEEPHEVEVRLAGRDYSCMAQIAGGDDNTIEFMSGYLEKRPIDAKAYGLVRDDVGRITRDQIASIAPQIVLIRMELPAAG